MRPVHQSLAFLSHYDFSGEPHSEREVTVVCPFHDDTHPSLSVLLNEARLHCWACGWHGPVVRAVAQIEKVTELRALILLSRWSKQADVEDVGRKLQAVDRGERLRVDQMQCHWRNFPPLVDSESRAEYYMIERGFDQETLRKWRFRYDETSEWPVVFPILQFKHMNFNGDGATHGEAVCWQRRRIDDVDTRERPKYKWSEGSRFSRTVAGWLMAPVLVICEGYLDMVMAWQHLQGSQEYVDGVRVCSPLTWKMRTCQAGMLGCDLAVVALDNDERGKEGADEILGLLPRAVNFEYDIVEKDIGEMSRPVFMRQLLRAMKRAKKLL